MAEPSASPAQTRIFDFREDIAYVHDAGAADFARKAAPALLEILRGNGIPRGRVVDLGCGTGVWARELLQAGYRVTGVDTSRDRLLQARQTAPEAQLKRAASLHDAELPPCNAVTALNEALNYVAPDFTVFPKLEDLFLRVSRALRPGGVFVFDLLVQIAGRPLAFRTWETGDDWAVLVEAGENRQRRVMTRDITTFRLENDLYRRSHEVRHLAVQGRVDVEWRLQKAGFAVKLLDRYGDFLLPTRRVGFQARKVREV
ncbi:MAG TPA: class I SAM-dependent methyltransferase [Thermoanaerobaculia bacterium]|nr:class I SAM-dependent methyltransferase [Thermoanaerobaculia bacterium]